jgi:tetratricopeptide (TPR) repeat protein
MRGDPDHAIADADEAIRLDPKDAAAFRTRGKALTDKGAYDRAIADYQAALKLDPKLADVADDLLKARALASRPEVGEPAQPDQTRQPVATLQPAPTKRPVDTPNPPSRLSSSPERRVALLIGMSAYVNVAPLRNPARDARAVADALRRLGFAEVIERDDLTRSTMEQTLKDFGDRAADADWAVIYYAGYGVEMDGVNYLIPVDAKLARADHVEDETVSVRRVLSKAEPAHKLRMVILDACRNNPFPMASAEGRPHAIGRGLSRIEPAGDVLVAYAARNGTVADDGDGEHSPFTQALLTYLETPDLDLGIMFRKVRDSVLARTKNAQEPFTYGSLPGQEFYFKQAVQ